MVTKFFSILALFTNVNVEKQEWQFFTIKLNSQGANILMINLIRLDFQIMKASTISWTSMVIIYNSLIPICHITKTSKAMNNHLLFNTAFVCQYLVMHTIWILCTIIWCLTMVIVWCAWMKNQTGLWLISIWILLIITIWIITLILLELWSQAFTWKISCSIEISQKQLQVQSSFQMEILLISSLLLTACLINQKIK